MARWRISFGDFCGIYRAVYRVYYRSSVWSFIDYFAKEEAEKRDCLRTFFSFGDVGDAFF